MTATLTTAETKSSERGTVTSNVGAVQPKAAPDSSIDLVAEIMRLRASIGDGLNELEMAAFLKYRLSAPDANGFSFLAISNGYVTFGVPSQDLAAWYGESCTIAPAKEATARKIAEQHRLTLCEPPDKLLYGSPGPGDHRHLEFANRWRAVGIAHPFYVKLRVCGGGEHESVLPGSDAAIAQCSGLLRDLAALYR